MPEKELKQKIYNLVRHFNLKPGRIIKGGIYYTFKIYSDKIPIYKIYSTNLNNMYEEVKYYLEVGYD